MRHKLAGIVFLALISCATCFGQRAFQGLTPGQSTKANVVRVLGQPVTEISKTFYEYKSDKATKQIFVQYLRDSAVVARIELVYAATLERTGVIRALSLQPQPNASQINSKGQREEYFATAAVVLTYGGAEITSGVSRVGYYSRELFESALSKKPTDIARAASNSSLSGRWSGSWSNSRGESGDTSVNINEQDTGTITGDEDGWVIENGQRSRNVLTWEYRNQNNGCRDYSVRWQVSSDGQTANGTYKVTDRCEKQTYTGTYLNYRR